MKDLPQAEIFEFDATFDMPGQEDPFSKNKPIKNGGESTAQEESGFQLNVDDDSLEFEVAEQIANDIEKKLHSDAKSVKSYIPSSITAYHF